MYKKKLEDDIRCPLDYGLTIFGANGIVDRKSFNEIPPKSDKR